MDKVSFSLAVVAHGLDKSSVSREADSVVMPALNISMPQSKASDVHVFNLEKFTLPPDPGKSGGIFDLPAFGSELDNDDGISLSELADNFQAKLSKRENSSRGLFGNSGGILELPAFDLADDDDGISLSDLADAFQADISRGGSTTVDNSTISCEGQLSSRDIRHPRHVENQLGFGNKLNSERLIADSKRNEQFQNNFADKPCGLLQGLGSDNDEPELMDTSTCASVLLDDSTCDNTHIPVDVSKQTSNTIDLTTLIGSRRRTESDRTKPAISVSQSKSTTDSVSNYLSKSWTLRDRLRSDSLPTDITMDNSQGITKTTESKSLASDKLHPDKSLISSKVERISSGRGSGRVCGRGVGDIYIQSGQPSGLSLAFRQRSSDIQHKNVEMYVKDCQQMASLFLYANQTGKMCSVRTPPRGGAVREGGVKRVKYEITAFDFSTPSPDDIVKRSQRKAFS